MNSEPMSQTGSARQADKPERASIYDVAKRAGVSHMTVSRVMNGHPNIRESTRVRVVEAIEALNYTRSSIARALVTKRSMRIGVFLDGPVHFGSNSVLRAFEIAARRRGYTVNTLSADEHVETQIDESVFEFARHGIDALCIIAPRASSIDKLRRSALDLLTLVVKDAPEEGMHTFAVDQRAGAREAVRHLIELGHREILHLAGPSDWYDAQARASAWRDVLTDAGLTVRELSEGDWSADSGYEFARTVELGDATSVFVANDQMALGVMHGLRERGIRVPDDVSVVGFDDMPEASHYLPPLTTVRQDFVGLGEQLVDALVAIIDGQDGVVPKLVSPTLVVRDSTAPPREIFR